MAEKINLTGIAKLVKTLNKINGELQALQKELHAQQKQMEALDELLLQHQQEIEKESLLTKPSANENEEVTKDK